MGRKIPGKKHRTVKDPYKQHATRFDAVRFKINKAPSRPDDQPIPRRLQQLMNWKNVRKEQPKPNVNKAQVKKSAQVSNPVNKLQRLDGESHKSFNMRINEAIRTLKSESTFKDIIEHLPEENDSSEGKDRIRRKKKKKTDHDQPKLSKSQKLYIKQKEKRDHRRENVEFEKKFAVKRDDVKFGEVVHEPPSLKIRPRLAANFIGAPRPARKDLLLNQLFEKPDKSKQIKSVDLRGKRKDLPHRVRESLETSRREAIDAYREIKKLNTTKDRLDIL